ncbi:MAG: cyanoexosortase A [Calothrix sp. C42_A2020_038]|nr:cyanoexosortase A [Calothrix sp. C42_A2020_038]
MKAKNLKTNIQFKCPEFWLLATAVGCIAIHLTLVWKVDSSNLLSISLLFWASVSCLIWERRTSLYLHSGIISSLVGLLILILLLVKVASMSVYGNFLCFLPPLFGISLALLSSGFQGLKQYRKEFLVLFAFCIISILPGISTDISPLTAKFAAFVLWYSGSEVVRSGENIYLQTGSVEVYQGCSGIELICQMLGIGILFLSLFPLKLWQKILVPTVSAIIGFIVNGMRVVLMANLVASNQKELFDYWHVGDGSLIFSFIAVLILGLLCWFILRQNQLMHPNKRSLK